MKEGIVPSIPGRDVSYTVIEHYNIELKWFNKLKGGMGQIRVLLYPRKRISNTLLNIEIEKH